MKTIKLGSKGEEVKILQKYLNLKVDGDFGAKTDLAVKEFQKKNGLDVDGIVGNNTWKVILSVSSDVIYDPLSVHITKSLNRPIKYLSIHFTAGSSSKPGKALNTKKVFETRSASADFCIDDRDIVQFNPDLTNYYCWAVGDKKYNGKGGSLYKKATNKNTISIEICSTCKPSTTAALNYSNHSGWSFSPEVLENAVKLSKILMQKYNIPIENVVRHYDITGKPCPGIIGWNDEPIYDLELRKYTNEANNSKAWLDFKNQLR